MSISCGGVLFEQVDWSHKQVGDKLDYMSGSVQMPWCHRVQDTLQPYLLTALAKCMSLATQICNDNRRTELG